MSTNYIDYSDPGFDENVGVGKLGAAEPYKRIAELEAALAPFAAYAEKRLAQPVKGLGDVIHTIHGGTEWEGEIRFSHCLAAHELLRK